MKSNNVWTTFIKRGLSLVLALALILNSGLLSLAAEGDLVSVTVKLPDDVIGSLVLISDIYSTIAQEADGTWKLNANQSYQYHFSSFSHKRKTEYFTVPTGQSSFELTLPVEKIPTCAVSFDATYSDGATGVKPTAVITDSSKSYTLPPDENGVFNLQTYGEHPHMYDRDYFYTIPADGYAPELDLTKADQAIVDGYAAAITSAVKGLSRQPRGGSYDMDTVKYRITVKAGPGGSISPATASVKKGADQEFIIIADEGFDIEDVLVDGASIGKVGSYTFTNVKEEHTIEATFSQAAKDPGDEPWSNPFTDVTGHWALGAIEYVSVKGLFDGTSATTFTPDGAMTRAMLVTVLHRMEISPAAGASQFSDVPDGQWYAQAVAWAAENKIVDGYGGGLFGPNDPVTREQMAVILHRYAKAKGYNVSAMKHLDGFSDKGCVSAYAEDALKWAVGARLIVGRSNGLLAPQGNITRAEVATILMRFAQNIAK